MNQLTIRETPATSYYLEQRKFQRFEVLNLLAVTKRGTGQILDLSLEGLSFGCLYPHKFPDEFCLDILDAKGSHIKMLKVRKTWEANGDNLDSAGIYELIVGLEFSELTSAQLGELSYLLGKSEQIENSYPHLIQCLTPESL